jgi:hypothetical protein
MAKLTKNQKEALAKFDNKAVYSLSDAAEIVKKSPIPNLMHR